MICPRCGAEYRTGFSRCNDCDVELVEELEGAPAAEEEGEDRLVPLPPFRDPELLGALLEALEDERIPYVVVAGTALPLAEGGALPDPGEPDFWEARVRVLARSQARAGEILRGFVRR